MSIKVLYEKKRYEESTPYFLFPDAPVESARGCLVGSDVVVDNNASMIFLLENGFYGSFLGQRMNFYNTSCFPKPADQTTDFVEEPTVNSDEEVEMDVEEPNMQLVLPTEMPAITDPGVEWVMNVNIGSQRRFYLSAEEAVYLAKMNKLDVDGKTLAELWDFYVKRDGLSFKRRFLVYEYFRNLGWVVRPAVNFSGDFSLYKQSPKVCHSTAVVQIVPDLDLIHGPSMFAMRRHLKNVKKTFLLVTVILSSDQTWDSVGYNSKVRIETFNSKTPLMANKIELLKI